VISRSGGGVVAAWWRYNSKHNDIKNIKPPFGLLSLLGRFKSNRTAVVSTYTTRNAAARILLLSSSSSSQSADVFVDDGVDIRQCLCPSARPALVRLVRIRFRQIVFHVRVVVSAVNVIIVTHKSRRLWTTTNRVRQ